MRETQEAIAQIIAPLQERRSELLVEREDLMQQVSALNEEVKTIDRVLKAADKVKAEPTGNDPGVMRASDEAIEKVYQATQKFDQFTVNDIAAVSGMHRSTVTQALKALREREKITLLGRQARQPNEIGLTPFVYRAEREG